jgi:hypothetical protein
MRFLGFYCRYGSIMISCNTLRDTIDTEIRQWISIYGKAMQVKYKREMDFIVAQVLDFDRKLDRQISDLDDIRIIMETQKKIRDQGRDSSNSWQDFSRISLHVLLVSCTISCTKPETL